MREISLHDILPGGAHALRNAPKHSELDGLRQSASPWIQRLLDIAAGEVRKAVDLWPSPEPAPNDWRQWRSRTFRCSVDVYIPPGAYHLTKTLIIPAGVNIICSDATWLIFRDGSIHDNNLSDIKRTILPSTINWKIEDSRTWHRTFNMPICVIRQTWHNYITHPDGYSSVIDGGSTISGGHWDFGGGSCGFVTYGNHNNAHYDNIHSLGWPTDPDNNTRSTIHYSFLAGHRDAVTHHEKYGTQPPNLPAGSTDLQHINCFAEHGLLGIYGVGGTNPLITGLNSGECVTGIHLVNSHGGLITNCRTAALNTKAPKLGPPLLSNNRLTVIDGNSWQDCDSPPMLQGSELHSTPITPIDRIPYPWKAPANHPSKLPEGHQIGGNDNRIHDLARYRIKVNDTPQFTQFIPLEESQHDDCDDT